MQLLLLHPDLQTGYALARHVHLHSQHSVVAVVQQRNKLEGFAHQRLQRGPLRLELLLLRQLFAFGDLIKLRIELRQLGGVQAELENSALLTDRHRGLVRDGALDVVDGNAIAEVRPRVRVRLFDRRAGEPDERRIRQGIAEEEEFKTPSISS
jgi:hypothetical protein